jgi:hypothetical protein
LRCAVPGGRGSGSPSGQRRRRVGPSGIFCAKGAGCGAEVMAGKTWHPHAGAVKASQETEVFDCIFHLTSGTLPADTAPHP